MHFSDPVTCDRLSSLFPPPQRISRLDGTYLSDNSLAIDLPPAWEPLLAADLALLAEVLCGRVKIVQAKTGLPVPEQAYRLKVKPDGITLTAATAAGARYGLCTLRRLATGEPLLCCEIEDWPTLPYRGIQIDLGRVIERPEVVEQLLPLYASFNYNVLQLYFENAFVFPSHLELARPFAWTLEQAQKVVDAASSYGITVIPAIQALGHCAWVTQHPDYAELDERHDTGEFSGVLCPSHPRTLPMLEGMIRDVAPLATSGIIHLGLDESFAIGVCERCRPQRDTIGEGGIYVAHANKVAALTKAAGKRPAIWGDMFYYYPDDLKDLDKDTLIFDWYYYTFPKTPRVELYNFADIDSMAMWKAHGLEAWGCPSSAWSVTLPYVPPQNVIGNAWSWTRYLKESDQPGIMVTQWEMSPATIDFAPAVEGALAGFQWGSADPEKPDALFAAACESVFGTPKVAPLISEAAQYSLHGHCDLRWLRAPSLADMLTYAPGEDSRRADILEDILEELGALAANTDNADMLSSYLVGISWLMYQYRKRLLLNMAAELVVDGEYAAARAPLEQLCETAAVLAEVSQAQWDRNRYPDDASVTPKRLRTEVEMYETEMWALDAALEGEPYTGVLNKTILAVHITNSHPAVPIFTIATSTDGETFTDRGRGTVLMFDAKAAAPTSDDELLYSFALETPEDARFVKLTTIGDGQFTLRGITLHRGQASWSIGNIANADGRITGAETLPAGGTALLGHPDPKALFQQLLKENDGGQVFSVLHGHVIVEMVEG
ncbi:MAG: family 20 glycosylhydrolase [Armatimonadota bacterium]